LYKSTNAQDRLYSRLSRYKGRNKEEHYTVVDYINYKSTNGRD